MLKPVFSRDPGVFRPRLRLPLLCGPHRMNIAQPLLRALNVAEMQLRFLHERIPKRVSPAWPSRKRLPRLPLRLPRLPLRFVLLAGTRRIPHTIHKRFFSAEARRRRRDRRKFVRWWTLTSLAILLGGVAAKARYERMLQDDEGDFDHYSVRPQLWPMYAYSTLPLKTMSRLWGQVNSINLPVWMRLPSYKVYLYIFGVNLGEMEEPDLTTYANLLEFFYRSLRPGVRPLADLDLVLPSDGKVLQFGVIDNGEIEQVKGMTYSVDALLGLAQKRVAATHLLEVERDHASDEDFASLHGMQVEPASAPEGLAFKDHGDGLARELKPDMGKNLSVAQDLAAPQAFGAKKNLYFAVIYLAPGDYHRFHSPTNWVTTLRRHFIGELFSVAPFFQKTLEGLFVLNERVALLGYWKYGFFSMVPVGATNVGSIVVNFDKDLKTNDVYEHEVYSRLSETTPLLQDRDEKRKRLQKNSVYEATYTNASRFLGGFPLRKGEEVGGFKLGSTVVLVFEAPESFRFTLEVGQKIQMGESLGRFN